MRLVAKNIGRGTHPRARTWVRNSNIDLRRAKYCGSDRPTGPVTEEVLDGKLMLMETSVGMPDLQFSTDIYKNPS